MQFFNYKTNINRVFRLGVDQIKEYSLTWSNDLFSVGIINVKVPLFSAAPVILISRVPLWIVVIQGISLDLV